jgi:hypothetical protein
MSDTLKIGELVVPAVEQTMVDAKTVPFPLPGLPATPVTLAYLMTPVSPAAEEAPVPPVVEDAPAPPPAPEPPPPQAEPSPLPAAPVEARPGPSTELREFIAMLRRDRKNEIHIRRLKRTAWAVAAAAGLVYMVHRYDSRSAPPADAAVAFEAGEVTESASPTFHPPPVESAASPEPAAVVIPPETASRVAEQAGCEESFTRQRWRAAVESCTRAFEQAPGPELALRIAHAHWSRGQAGPAGDWARKALRLGNRDADAFVLIGHAEREAGHGTRAAAAYRRYLESSPRGWHARRLRAAIRELKRKTAYGPSARRAEHVIR